MNILHITKKRIFFILILLFLVILGAAGLALLNLGKVVNANKDRIVAKAEEVLGRKVAVNKIDVTLWTGVGVTLSQFSVADDSAYSQENFVGADTLDIYFQLLPLFHKQLEISHLILQKPVIRIVQNKEGQYNFSTFKSLQKAGNSDANAPASTASPSTTLSLARLEVVNGSLVFKSEKTKQDFRLEQCSVAIDNFSLDKPFPAKIEAAFLGDKRNLSFNGQFGPISAGAKQQLGGDLKFTSISLTALSKLPFLQSAFPPSLACGGDVDGTIHLQGNLDNLQIKINVDASGSSLVYDKQYEKPKGIPFKIAADTQYSGDAVDLKKIDIQLAVLEVDGKGKIGFGKNAAYDLSFQSKPVDVSWLASVAQTLKPYNPSGKASLQAVIKNKGNSPQTDGTLSLENVRAQIPNLMKPITNLNGKIQLNSGGAKSEGLTFQLGQSKISLQSDINQFSPLAGSYKIASEKLPLSDLIKTTENTQNDVLEGVLVSGTLNAKKGIQSSGTLASEKGTFYGLNYTSLNSPYKMENQILAFDNLSLKTLSGEVICKANYNMQQKPPKFDVSTQTKSIDLTELVRTKLPWFPQFVQGKVNLNMDMAGSGNSWDTIKPSLKGNGSISISDGMILNVNLADKVLGGLTGMPGVANFITTQYKDQYPRVFASEHTVFQDLKLDAVIEGGKINFKNMVISAADWAINGEGWLNIGESLQSDALLRLSKDFSTFLSGKVGVFKYLIDDNGNMSVPFSMTGVLPTIKPAPNKDLLGGLFQKALAGQVTEKLNIKGLPGLGNLLPFDTSSKKKQNLPEIPADKTAASRVSNATKETTSPKRESQATKEIRSATEILSATPEITQPTEITPKDVLNPLMKLFDKKKTKK